MAATSTLQGRSFQVLNPSGSTQRRVANVADTLWSPYELDPNFKKRLTDIISRRPRSIYQQSPYDKLNDDPRSILHEKTSSWRASHLITMGSSSTPWICASDTDIIFYRSDGKISLLNWLLGDFMAMEGEQLLEKEALQQVDRKANVYGVVFTGTTQQRSLLGMLINEIDRCLWWLVLYDLHSSNSKAKLVTEQLLDVQKEAIGCQAQLFRGTSDELYCVFWDTLADDQQQQKQREYLSVYSVIRVNIDTSGNTSLETLIENKSITGRWFLPSIVKDALYFLVDAERPTNRYEFLKIPLFQGGDVETIALSRSEIAFCPRFLTWSSQTCCIEDHILFYNFNEARKIGILFAFDIFGKVWRNVLELTSHAVIGSCSIAVSPNKEMLYLNGKCVERDCPEGSHLYKFPVDGLFLPFTFLQPTAYPTIQQVWAMKTPKLYSTPIEVIHGPSRSGKSTVIRLKFLEAIEKGEQALLYFSERQQPTNYLSYLKENALTPNNHDNCIHPLVQLEKDILLKSEKLAKSIVFIDCLSTFNHKHKSWLLERLSARMKVIVALDFEVQHSHWREGLIMTRLLALNSESSTLMTEERQESNKSYKNKSKSKSNDNALERFETACQFAMDKFFEEWRNEQSVIEKSSFCIPECSDTEEGRYLGTNDPLASGFVADLIRIHSAKLTGSRAEDKVLNALRNLRFGGFIIRNFQINELIERLKLCDLKKAKSYEAILTMQKFETDIVICHPKTGLFLIEIKELVNIKSNENIIETIKKCKKQLDTGIKSFKLMYEHITGNSCDIPVDGAFCFPSTKEQRITSLLESAPKKTAMPYNVIGEESMEAPARLKDLLFGKAREGGFWKSAEFQQFVSVIVGIRSSVELSFARNALAIHQMLQSQEYMKERKSKRPSSNSQRHVHSKNDNSGVGCERTSVKTQSREDMTVDSETSSASASNGQSAKSKSEPKPVPNNPKSKIQFAEFKHTKPVIASNSIRTAAGEEITYANENKLENEIKVKPFKFVTDDESESTIFLNPQQLSALESSCKQQIIFGPPGSGKTLLILLKVLEAARQDKIDKVIVFSRSRSLRTKFRHFFGKNMKELKRQIAVVDNLENISDDDDYFGDEEMLFDDTLRLLKERLKNNANGCTVIAITGIQSPRRILTLTADLEKTHLDKTFEISELQTVLRGSKCIIDAWKSHFPDNYVHQGHNIIGNPVTWIQCAATEIKQTLYQGLMPLLAQFDGHFNSKENDTERGIEPRDIAILVDDAVIVQELTKFLNDKWITCGTVEEQANDPLLIAVDHFEQSISYEWPIVFAVGHKSVDADDSYGLVAASRAMALLINVHTGQHRRSLSQVSFHSALRSNFNILSNSAGYYREMADEGNNQKYASPMRAVVSKRLGKILETLKTGPSDRKCSTVARWAAKILFWALVYLLGSYLSIRTCITLYEDYRFDSVSTNVIMSTNMEFTLPNITACLPFNSTQVFPLNSSSDTPYSDAILEFFASNTINGRYDFIQNRAEGYDVINGVVPNEAMFVLQKYLAILYEAEMMHDSGENPFKNLRNQTGDEYTALLDILVPKMIELNMTINDIKTVFTNYFEHFDVFCGERCDFFSANSFLEVEYSFDENIYYIENEDLTYWNEKEMCIAIRSRTISNFLKANESDNFFGISLWLALLKNASFSITIDYGGSLAPPSSTFLTTGKDIYEIDLPAIGSQTIHLQSIHYDLPLINGMQSCFVGQTRQECEIDCRREQIKKLCGCSSMTFGASATDEEICTFVDYERCLNYSGNEDEECRKKCLDSCEIWKYRISEPISRGPDDISHYERVFFILIDKIDFLTFQSAFKLTFEDFLGAVGGALGLYLGMDLINFIHFIHRQLVSRFLYKCMIKLSGCQGKIATIIFNVRNFFKRLSVFAHSERNSGNSYIFILKWFFKNQLWLLFYAAGGLYTLKFCYVQYRQYRMDNIHTTFSLNNLNNNKSLTLPPIALCFSLSLGDLLSKRANPDYKTTPVNSMAIVEFLNRDGMTKEEFLRHDEGSEWPIEMTNIAYHYLRLMNMLEMSATEDFPMTNDTWRLNICWSWTSENIVTLLFGDGEMSPEAVAALDDYINAIDNVLITKLSQWNVTIDELRQKLGYELNKLLQLKILFFKNELSNTTFETRTTVFAWDGYCIKALIDAAQFTSSTDYIEISSDISNVTNTTEPILAKFSDDLTDFNMLFDDFNYFNQYTKLYYGKATNRSLRLDFIMERASVSNNSVQCTNDITREICQARARINLIEKMCNCSPSSWPSLLNPKSEVCSMEVYKHCLNYDGTEDRAEKNKCLSPCRIVDFSIKEVVEPLVDENGLDDSFRMVWRIKVADFTYLKFEERSKRTTIDLIAAIGGGLGIILGLDLSILPWVVSTLLFMVLRYLLPKIFPQTANSISENNHGCKQLIRLIGSSFNLDISAVLKASRYSLIEKSLKIGLWSMVYAVGGFLTLQMASNLFRDYRNERRSVNINLVDNKSIALHSPAICLSFIRSKRGLQDAEESGTDDISIRDFLIMNDNILYNSWNSTFVGIARKLIGQYENCEMLLYDDSFTPCSKNDSTANIILKFEEKMKLLQISVRQLRDKLGIELLKMHSIRITSFNTTHIEEHFLKISFVDDSKVCYKFAVDGFVKFNSTTDYLIIRVNGSVFHQYGTRVTLDLKGRDVSSNEASIIDSTILMKFGRNIKSVLRIEKVIKALPSVKGKIQCSQEQTMEECIGFCRIHAFQDQCKCSPNLIKLGTESDTTRPCHLTDYEKCYFRALSESKQCINDCVALCEQLYLEAENKILPIESDMAEINLRMQSLSYKIFQEQLLYTADDFISQLGGILGVFIGLNFFIFVEFFYKMFVRIFTICFKDCGSQAHSMHTQN